MSAETSSPDVERALRTRDFASVRQCFADLYPADIAELIEALEEDERALIFRMLPREQAAETFEYLEPEAQEGLIKGLAREQVASILNDMAPDDRTALLEELPATVTRQLLTLLTPEERQVARKLLMTHLRTSPIDIIGWPATWLRSLVAKLGGRFDG